jgi:hypothetical protein
MRMRMRVFEYRILRHVSATKNGEVTAGWVKVKIKIVIFSTFHRMLTGLSNQNEMSEAYSIH